MSFPIGLLTSIDPVLRATASASLALSGERIAVVRHDIDEVGVRRIVSDYTGVIEDSLTPLEHSCLTCAIREDAMPTLERLAREGSWAGAVLALPLGADSAPVAATMDRMIRGSRLSRTMRVAGIATAIDAATIADDAFDDEFLEDRGVGWGSGLVVAEALGPQLLHADVLAVHGDLDDRADATVTHLTHPDTLRVAGTDALTADALLSRRFHLEHSACKVDPLQVRHYGAQDRAGVWTIDLHSHRPLHPVRLRENLRLLAEHSTVARGHFWIPARPQEPCIWDCAAGQLSIGTSPGWRSPERSTRIVVTGNDDSRDTIREAFADTLVRADEALDPACAIDNLADWLDEAE